MADFRIPFLSISILKNVIHFLDLHVKKVSERVKDI
jgi:hypothetical protein